jgi:glycosyltransferase involved in cell wall biosynthesis
MPELTDSPKFSVIIANYNYGRFLKDCILSVLAQDYEPKEVILVDDGSTDNSREVIQSFGGQVTPFFKQNGGQVSSWNVGIARASGEFIVLLDSDDLLEPGIMQVYAQAFADAHVVRCHGVMSVVDRDGALTGELTPDVLPAEGELAKAVIERGPYGYCCVAASGNAWRATFLKDILPLPENAGAAADLFLFPLAPFYGKTIRVQGPTARYRIHGAGITHTKRAFNIENIRRAVGANDCLCDWTVGMANRRGVVIDPILWRQRDWRVATLRYFLAEEGQGDKPSVRNHLGGIRFIQDPVRRAGLLFAILAIRTMPHGIAFRIASRAIHLGKMA